MNPFKLPEDFLFGTATSSLQIEGGDKNNNWYEWAKSGKIKDGSKTETACDHWNRIEKDIEIMKILNLKIYRMSIEWSRIEPEKDVFSHEAILHYRKEIELLRKNNIEPLVTLHHFSNPVWFDKEGGWTNRQSVNLFEKYTEYVVRNIGDLVTEWVTINEPNVLLVNSYIYGIWPPGIKNYASFFKAVKNIISAHILSYKKIHEISLNLNSNDIMVGIANHIRIFEPKRKKTADKIICWIYNYLFNDLFIKGMHRGMILPPLGFGYIYGRGRYYDFIGINYYTRDILNFVFNKKLLFAKIKVKKGSEQSDLGWEIYPEGLYGICKLYYKKYKKPIYITENGISDKRDEKRIKFIYDHLFQISKLIDEGVDIKKYYHWTLMDNFEWLEGYQAKFGLVEVNFGNQARRIRKSGMFYSEICAGNQVSQKILDKYVNKRRFIEYFISEDD
jgi:beta-glucosidase